MDSLAYAICLSSSTVQSDLRKAQEIINKAKLSPDFGQQCFDLLERPLAFNLQPHHTFALVIQLRLWVKEQKEAAVDRVVAVNFIRRLIVLLYSAVTMQVLKISAETLFLATTLIDAQAACAIIAEEMDTLISNLNTAITDKDYFSTPIGNTDLLQTQHVQKLASTFVVTVIAARFRTVMNMRNFLNQILTPSCIQALLRNINVPTPLAPRSMADYCFQYSLMALTYSLSPIILRNTCLQLETIFQTIHGTFERILNDDHYIPSSLYTVLIFLTFFQNLWSAEFRARSRAENLRTDELKLFLKIWRVNKLNDIVFQVVLHCLRYFSGMILKPLPLALNNATCEHVLGLIYNFITSVMKSSDPKNAITDIMTHSKEILSMSDTLMHKIIANHLSHAQAMVAEQPVRIFSLAPKDIALAAAEGVDDLFYANVGATMNWVKNDQEETEAFSQIDIGIDFKIMLDEIIKANMAMMKFLSEEELCTLLGKLSDMAQQLLHGPIAAITQANAGRQVVVMDVNSSSEFFIALTNAPGALTQLRKMTPQKDIDLFDSKVGDLIHLLLGISPYLSSFLASRVFWLINEFIIGDVVINESILLPILPMPILKHLEDSKSSTEAFISIILCKNLMSRLYIYIDFRRENSEGDVMQHLKDIQPSVMIGTLANILVKVPSETTFYADLFELLTSTLEVCSFLDPISTIQCLEMLLQSVLNDWQIREPQYLEFSSYYAQHGAIHPCLFMTSNVLATITTIYASSKVPLSHLFFCYTCSLVQKIFCFLHPLLEFAYSNLLTTAASALGAIYGTKEIYYHNVEEKRAITRQLFTIVIEFVMQYDDEFDLLPEFLPLLIGMANYLGVVGDREVVQFVHASLATQYVENPDYLFAARLIVGAYFSGLTKNFQLLAPEARASLSGTNNIYLGIVDSAMKLIFDVPVSSNRGYSTTEQNVGALLYMCIAAALLLVVTTQSLVFFEKYNSQKVAILFYALPRMLVPLCTECDLALDLSALVFSLSSELSSFAQGQSFLSTEDYGASLRLSTQILASPQSEEALAVNAPTRAQIWNGVMEAGIFTTKQEDLSADDDTFNFFVEVASQIVNDAFIYMESIFQTSLLTVSFSGVQRTGIVPKQQ